MKLILTQEVDGLGAAGDVVEVKDGYGRNFLIPRSLAIRWTRGGESVDFLSQDQLHGLSPLSATCGRVGQKGDLAGVLDRDRHIALVLHAVAGHPASADLSAVGDELA